MKALKFCSEEFIKKIEDYIRENKYEYKIIRSTGPTDLYEVDSEDALIKAHIEHISRDYLIDEGYETVISYGYVEDDVVSCELLMRKLK